MGVMIDESTDIAVSKNLIVYVRYIGRDYVPATNFFALKECEGSTADQISGH